MYMFGNLIIALAKIIDIALTIYMWMIIIRAVLSWVNPDPYNPIVQFLYRATEPLMYRVRKLLPIGNLGIDVSPIIIILVIIFIQTFVVASLTQLGYQLK